MYQKKKGPSKMKQDDLEAAEAREREAAEQARLQKEEAERKEQVKFLMLPGAVIAGRKDLLCYLKAIDFPAKETVSQPMFPKSDQAVILKLSSAMSRQTVFSMIYRSG